MSKNIPFLSPQQLANYHLDRNRVISTCEYCGIYTVLTKDHIIPQAHGGQDTRDNIAMVCLSCNVDKADRTLQEWYPTIQNPSRKSLVSKLMQYQIYLLENPYFYPEYTEYKPCV